MNINSGIYRITNTLNGHCYIGSSVNVRRRLLNHKNLFKRGKHCSKYFQRAWDKYGGDCFIFEPLIYCDKDNLFIYEQAFIDYYHPAYNLAKCAENPMLGMKHSEETIKKISLLRKGRKNSQETRNKISVALMGRTLTAEWKEKIAAGNKGKFVSEETREKLRQYNLGMRASPETRKKMSASQLLRFKRERELNVTL